MLNALSRALVLRKWNFVLCTCSTSAALIAAGKRTDVHHIKRQQLYLIYCLRMHEKEGSGYFRSPSLKNKSSGFTKTDFRSSSLKRKEPHLRSIEGGFVDNKGTKKDWWSGRRRKVYSEEERQEEQESFLGGGAVSGERHVLV